MKYILTVSGIIHHFSTIDYSSTFFVGKDKIIFVTKDDHQQESSSPSLFSGNLEDEPGMCYLF